MSQKFDDVPPMDRKIIKWLDHVFPPSPPTPSSNERADLYHAGARRVVERMKQELERQEESFHVRVP